MPDVNEVLSAFRLAMLELELPAGTPLYRRASEAAAAGAHPIHVEPPAALAPGQPEGDGDDPLVVVSLFRGVELGEATGYDASTRRRVVVDVRYRSGRDDSNRSAGLRRVGVLDAILARHLLAPERNYGYGFMLGGDAGIYAHAVTIWAGLGPISRGRGEPNDDVAKYLVECAR